MNIDKAFQLVSGKLSDWLQSLIQLLPNIVIAVLILVGGVLIAKWLKRISKKLIEKISKIGTINNLFSSFVYIFSLVLVVFVTLKVMHLDKALTSALAGLGIVGLALAFAFRDIAANFMSGIFISFRRPIHLNDIVKISGYMGRVEEVNLRDTVIRTFQGQQIVIPNHTVFQNPIENFTSSGKRRIDLHLRVDFKENLEEVKQITLDAVKNGTELSPDDNVTFFYEEIGHTAVHFVLRLWVKTTGQASYLKAGSDAIMAIKNAFDENKITIPYPIRTIDFEGTKLEKSEIGSQKS